MSKKPNVLVLESGGEAGIACIKILKKSGVANVFAFDKNPYTAASRLADNFFPFGTPSSEQEAHQFMDFLDNKGIDLVLPTFEFGLNTLATVADSRFVTHFPSAILCKDKLRFAETCRSVGIPDPLTLSLGSVDNTSSPVFIKPRFGAGSKNNFIAQDAERFGLIKKYLESLPEEFIVQKLLDGRHWSVDALVAEGSVRSVVTRENLLQKGGENMVVRIEIRPDIVEFTHLIQQKLGILSPFNLELFETESGFVPNEINCRFGGGVRFSAQAGLDLVSCLVTRDFEKLGKPREGIYSCYHEEVMVESRKRYL